MTNMEAATLSDQNENESTSVRVIVRVRPLVSMESKSAASNVVVVEPNNTITMVEDPTGLSKSTIARRSFAYDRVLGSEVGQEETYDAVGLPILQRALQGYNGCIFAYGQTGSGKTFTMGGADATASDPSAPIAKSKSNVSNMPSGAGVIARLCAQLFNELEARSRTGTTDEQVKKSKLLGWTVTAEYVEIYQEKVIDLLIPRRNMSPNSFSTIPAVPAPRANGFAANSQQGVGTFDEQDGPMIRQRPDGTIFLDGVATRPCRSAEDIQAVLSEGLSRRTKGETNMNMASSRSHAVLSLHVNLVYGEPRTGEDDADNQIERSSKIHLIDLAGSERMDATGATGVRMKEGIKINLSLTALGDVISALTTPGRGHVPYRNSKLTRLLQDALGGNAFTTMVCCVSPASSNYDETLASLRFAERAKKVKNVARINVDANAARIAALLAEVAALKAKVTMLEDALTKQGMSLSTATPVPIGATMVTKGGIKPIKVVQDVSQSPKPITAVKTKGKLVAKPVIIQSLENDEEEAIAEAREEGPKKKSMFSFFKGSGSKVTPIAADSSESDTSASATKAVAVPVGTAAISRSQRAQQIKGTGKDNAVASRAQRGKSQTGKGPQQNSAQPVEEVEQSSCSVGSLKNGKCTIM